MTIDPLVVIGAIGAMGTLLLFIIRQFLTGDLLSKNAVSRADFERVLAINEGYATKFGEQTEAVRALSTTVEKLADLSIGPSREPSA